MAYIGDYVVHRLTMPDESGNLLQPDVTRPDEQVLGGWGEAVASCGFSCSVLKQGHDPSVSPRSSPLGGSLLQATRFFPSKGRSLGCLMMLESALL